MAHTLPKDAADIVAALRHWARDVALPLWAEKGFDRQRGGFHERLDFSGRPDLACLRRTMVQARQIYVYARAGLLGWHPEGAEIALRGFEHLAAARHGRDGAPGYVHALTPDGDVADATRDAYDHAFVLLALSWLARATGEPRAFAMIDELLAFLDDHLADREGGFVEAIPLRLPRRQNPHMHVFEALLALHEATGHPEALPRAGRLLVLLTEKFIDPETGALREFFDAQWRPAAGPAGDHIEPGHHAEWVWLLHRYRVLAGARTDGLADALFAIAARFADPQSGLVVDEADRFGAIRKSTRRCWAQTEMAKAWLVRHEAGDPQAKEAALRVLKGIARDHLSGPFPGGWYDRVDTLGRPDIAFVPASAFYHLFGAITEADRVLGRPAKAGAPCAGR